MRNDFDRIDDGQIVKVFPDPASNILAKEPYEVVRYDNNFYAVKKEFNNTETLGPDYSLSNIARYCLGYEEVDNGPPIRDTKE